MQKDTKLEYHQLIKTKIHFVKTVYFFFSFIYFWETERAQVGRGRERRRQNPKQAPGSKLSAQSLTQGLNSRTVISWPEPKLDAQKKGVQKIWQHGAWHGAQTCYVGDHDLSWSQMLNQLGHPGTPEFYVLTVNFFFCFAILDPVTLQTSKIPKKPLSNTGI